MADIDDFSRLDQYVESETLTELCYKVICKNLDIISVKSLEVINEVENVRSLLKGLILPSEICDRLIEYALRSDTIKSHDEFFHIFQDTSVTKLKRIKVVRSNMSDKSAKILASHKLVELELIDCPYVTTQFIEYINDNAENLQSLTCREVGPPRTFGMLSMSNEYKMRGYVFKLPNLRSLALDINKKHIPDYYLLFAGMPNLTHLDLSNNVIIGFEFFSLFPNLISLVLYNVSINKWEQDFIGNLGYLKKLRHLDISQSNAGHKVFTIPNILQHIINSLPQLTSLDISGTNLAAGHKEDYAVQTVKQTSFCDSDDMSNNKLCDIPGLASRVNRPLQFLGLYGTGDGACRLRNIPAKLISGNANEDQILVAANVCMNNKVDLLLKALNDLYLVYRYENFHRLDQGLCVILDAMEKHPQVKSIQISGSATLFYVVKMKEKDEIEPRVKERIVRILLAGMSSHENEETMMRNGCLTLSQFRIPQDVMSNYETLVKLLLNCAKYVRQDDYVLRIAIFLLNSLSCQVTGREKRLLGNLGCIKTMLELIRRRITSNIFDDVLEGAWSTMWNMTDETPINCERFLDEDGMNLFHECIKKYRHREELLKNMMGLLGNVAEVQHLRVHLTQQQYISLFASLLDSDSEVIEIPYNAAGVLAHIASDGVEAWTVPCPSRDEVLRLMVQAIEHWDIRTGRNINYRSFLPLLRLLDVYHTPECQHWAVWALANLTNVYPHKYCKLLVKEKGPEKLTALLKDSRPNGRIRELAAIVYDNVMCYIFGKV
ncbi:protein zer-1 homolog isoform X2 [Megalopta genalis]|uniref:protein zer-1 homolog isoform X2 n=1 Tax=Megalopta genalis TaxID=115081 RepID=UPI0014432A87|nr:protein zer-1 homolog isoform X2 [Megalopta genalis]